MPTHALGDHYSSWVGLIYVFNLIVGTGALTLPFVFAQAGWLLSFILLSYLAFVSFITVSFIIESIACANATLYWQKIQSHRIDGENEVQDDCDSSENEASEESAIIHRRRARNYYSLNERVELVQMSSLYFNKIGRTLFYLALCIYLYGDLAIYVAAISDTVSDLLCKNVNTTYYEDVPCWDDSEVKKMTVYRVSVIIFISLVGPFSYFNVQKTKYLQILTSGMRWSAFLIMIVLACIHMSKHEGGSPEMFNFTGVPALIGCSVYSFMCHHSLPGLISPITEKRYIIRQLSADYLLICSFYLLLAMTGSFAFKDLKDLYTLNFIPSGAEELSLISKVILYFLGAFPIFTLSMSFPIIAITLQNNLKALFLDVNLIERYNFFLRRLAFPTLAIVPPVIVAFCTSNLGKLVEFTGAYAGAMIQYVIPTCLVWAARRTCTRLLGTGVTNKYASPFRSNFWLVFILLWAFASTIIVTINIITKSQ